MKRLIVLCLMVFALQAYELGFDTWNTYTIFDPGERAVSMSYPQSWMIPEKFLIEPNYEDSSSTFAEWGQLLSLSGTGMSNTVLAQYIPYSFPQRWSLGLNFISYKGPSPTDRSDAVFDFRHNKGSIKAYHTSHDQTLNTTDGTIYHRIKSTALNFDHHISRKISLMGGIDFQNIEQENDHADSIRNYNAHHEFIRGSYHVSESFQLYGKLDYRYVQNDGDIGSITLFRPGVKFNKSVFAVNLGLWITPDKIHPITEISLHPEPFYFGVFADVRDPVFILGQPAYQYYGMNAGINQRGRFHDIKAEIAFTYDNADIPTDFYMTDISGGYALKIKDWKIYVDGEYHSELNSFHYYYHPQIATVKSGLAWKSKLIDGKLLLQGNINTQYILHDDPDGVNFDPETLIYYKSLSLSPVGSWKLNFDLKAIIRTFDLTLNVSTPLNFNKDFEWHIYDGIRPTSDILAGNVFYAGLSISWFWWK